MPHGVKKGFLTRLQSLVIIIKQKRNRNENGEYSRITYCQAIQNLNVLILISRDLNINNFMYARARAHIRSLVVCALCVYIMHKKCR